MGIDCQLDEWLAMKAVYNSTTGVWNVFFLEGFIKEKSS
jgi:hypothetical protein